MRLTPVSRGQRRDTLLKVDSAKYGYSSLVDEARMNLAMSVQSLNMIQEQDGVWATRWGFGYYGQAITGESIIEGAFEYIKTDGSKEIIAIGGTTGTVYKCSDGGSWSSVSGATMTTGRRYKFFQIKSELYIVNGIDPLTRYNGTTLVRYTAISNPTISSINRTVLTAGAYTYYFRVTAHNDVGSTAPSAEFSITVNKEQTLWASTEWLDVTWGAVSGATRYQIYMSDQTGFAGLIDSTTSTTYKVTSSTIPNMFIQPAEDNSTGAPKAGDIESSGNRIWLTKDADNQYRVTGSGVGQYLGNFSSFYGGFWVDLEKGGRDKPISVVHYRTGKGDPIATVLCASPDGQGSTWQIEVTATTIDTVPFSIPVTYKIVGSIGADSNLAVVKASDNVFFANKQGISALRSKAQLVNVLATDNMSQNIRTDYKGLNQSQLENMCGYFYEGKVFFSAAEGSTNDTIFIYDLERNNWTWKWTQGVRQFFTSTDSNKNTRLLCVWPTGNQLVELSSAYDTDFGQPINWAYTSALPSVDKDKEVLIRARRAVFELGRPKGTITLAVQGIEAKRGFSTVGSRQVTDSVSTSGYSAESYSDMYYSDATLAPSSFTQATVKKAVKINKRLYNYQFKVSSNVSGSRCAILSIQLKGKLISKRPPSSWRK